ncbi:pyridoxamine 5'-phosphate oxidase family protein [Myxococcus sp. K15C18031901]|uniref:pyridoxamine 5'-phosphate oxidase family protein n=1 Tax=Myxococcus dinghuensis TaxID=2906761 RepID=UPI0020A7253F|nr:pyridoxamine 5'-phosphate oxidase family protein [Myxococcus dinghuensis]MCP3098330.1 pyridoxamine 5'-phosphate oxidase family protein [Myxococcus dinghuensis]
MASKRQHPGTQDAVEHLEDLVHGIRVAMMTTVQADGSLHSRPMWTQERDFDGELWFFTHEDSHKVEAVEHDHRVNLAFSDPARERYVSISGRARMVRDARRIRELWHPALEAWFPQGLGDPRLSLLCVRVEKAEYWDVPRSRMVQAAGMLKAVLSGKTYTPGDHQTLELDGGSSI